MYSSLRQEKKPVSRIQDLRKQDSRKTITRRLYDAGFVSGSIKKPLLSQKNIKDRINFLPEYGKFDSEWLSRIVWSDESRFQLHADAPERIR